MLTNAYSNFETAQGVQCNSNGHVEQSIGTTTVVEASESASDIDLVDFSVYTFNFTIQRVKQGFVQDGVQFVQQCCSQQASWNVDGIAKRIFEGQWRRFRFPATVAIFLKRDAVVTTCTSSNQNLTNAICKPKKMTKKCTGTVYKYDGFADKNTKWRNRQTAAGYLTDLHDASGFSQFKAYPTDSQPFVHLDKYHLLLTLNIDWFQHSDVIYNAKCIHMTIQNLSKKATEI
ncbi:hypothetical protein A0J61_09573 [Choanephora cucurbitarum]|uniref:Uncharacterized protein n=1 Tax=Choanephora cucurbitarum TaxID=101091 RepID=A0A1C7N178_9FUNG|nr:hypothetical protein A0J61_09573 [Choanephora cucurbitarum]